MLRTTLKRPFVTAALVGGLLVAAAPAGAAIPHDARAAVSDGTSNTVLFAESRPADHGATPAGFSWSENQTGSFQIVATGGR